MSKKLLMNYNNANSGPQTILASLTRGYLKSDGSFNTNVSSSYVRTSTHVSLEGATTVNIKDNSGHVVYIDTYCLYNENKKLIKKVTISSSNLTEYTLTDIPPTAKYFAMDFKTRSSSIPVSNINISITYNY